MIHLTKNNNHLACIVHLPEHWGCERTFYSHNLLHVLQELWRLQPVCSLLLLWLSVEELIRVMTKAVNELGLEWSPPGEPSRSRLDECFLPGHHQALHQRSSPFFPKCTTSSKNRGAPPTRLASPSVALTSVDGAEDKGYEHLSPIDESVAAHLCLPTAIGWKPSASHPSKTCRATSALAGRAYSAAGQAMNLFNTRVSQFELNYWNKLTFPQHSNLLRCICKLHNFYVIWYIYILVNRLKYLTMIKSHDCHEFTRN